MQENHRPKFIIKIGEHVFLNQPIHIQSAKFYFLKFEGKAYEICLFFPLRVNIKN